MMYKFFNTTSNYMDTLLYPNLDGTTFKNTIFTNDFLTNIKDTGEAEFEFPGISKENIKITAEKKGKLLSIRVVAKHKEKEITKYHVVYADKYDYSKITSSYNNGLLTVHIPEKDKTHNNDCTIDIAID